MKKYISTLLAMTVIAGIYGCGDNKTKEKLLGTAVVNSTNATGGNFLSNPDAASMTALYKVSFLGAGAGNFSYSAPRRGAPQNVPSSDSGAGLGQPNANGEYIIADPMGMSIKVKFQKAGQTVYMDMSHTLAGSSGLYLYPDQDVTATSRIMGEGFDPTTIASWPQYIPAMWFKASDGKPYSWYPLNSLMTLATDLQGLTAWMTGTAFPDSMTNTVSGSIPGGTMSMTMTSAMPSGCPTDAAPQSMTGSGTVTFDTGEAWTVTVSLSVGTKGPIGGTQTFSSTSGESGTMTFNSDGSMDGVMKKAGVTVGTIHIGADGNGTYTDVESGKTYTISGARPS